LSIKVIVRKIAGISIADLGMAGNFNEAGYVIMRQKMANQNMAGLPRFLFALLIFFLVVLLFLPAMKGILVRDYRSGA
jgi:hypothetical protein